MHINLEDGQILAYNFQLKASGSGGDVIINSEADTYPLQIGSNFKVSWSGVMESAGATINTATINTATINTATLTGTITGTNWNIAPSGIATFGNWSFNGNDISNSGNKISLSSGGLALYSANALNIFASSIHTSADLYLGEDLIVLGNIDNEQIKDHESRISALEVELVAARARIVELEDDLEDALEDAEYWEDRYNSHSCPEPDPSPGGNGGAGSE
jgi:hypothetical protein